MTGGVRPDGFRLHVTKRDSPVGAITVVNQWSDETGPRRLDMQCVDADPRIEIRGQQLRQLQGDTIDVLRVEPKPTEMYGDILRFTFANRSLTYVVDGYDADIDTYSAHWPD